MQLRKSSKKQAKIKLALQGCAGSGKTYSALLLAYGLCGDWTKIAVIDSENNSADLYAHLGQYNVLPLEGKYDPETYIDAIIKVCSGALITEIVPRNLCHVHVACGWQFVVAQAASRLPTTTNSIHICETKV